MKAPVRPKKNSTPRQKLGPGQRIRRAWVFKFIHDNGKFFRGALTQLWVYQDSTGRFGPHYPQLGLVVGRKTHTRAVERNRWKRRLREIFRKSQQKIAPGYLFLIQSRAGKPAPEAALLEKEWKQHLEKAGCWL